MQNYNLKLGWFATSKGTTSLKIFNYIYDLIKSKKLNVDIKFVFINRQYNESLNSDNFINTIKSYNIPIFCLSSLKFMPQLKTQNLDQWRLEFDRCIYNMIKNYDCDVILLAGYMLILSEFLCTKFNFINLHPALPWGPKGTWQEVIKEVIDKKHKEHGVMIHLVTKDLDRGPILTYCKFKIEKYDFEKIRQEGVKRELPLIKTTLELLANKELKISEGKIFYKEKILEEGLEIKLDF